MDWQFFEWLGWKNGGCLFWFFDANGNGRGRNVGCTILPLYFWHHIGFLRGPLGANNIRTWIGLGMMDIFWDSPIN